MCFNGFKEILACVNRTPAQQLVQGVTVFRSGFHCNFYGRQEIKQDAFSEGKIITNQNFTGLINFTVKISKYKQAFNYKFQPS